MLTRDQDYAHQQPSLTAQKLRRLEIAAGAPVREGKPSGVWVTHQKMRHAEKELAAQAQASYQRMVRGLEGRGPEEGGGRERDSGARIVKSLKRGQDARQT